MKLKAQSLLALAVTAALASCNVASVSGSPSPAPPPAPLSKMGQVCASGLTSAASGSASAQAALAAAEGQQTMIKGMLLGKKTSENCKLCKLLLEGRLSSQKALQDYAMGLIPLGAPGFAFFALTLLVFPFFMLSRCCCSGRCCKAEKKVEDQEFLEQFLPVFFYGFFGAIALGFSVFGTTKIGGFSNGMIGMICQARELAVDSSAFIDSIDQPVQNMASLTISQIDAVAAAMNSTGPIASSLTTTIALFEAYVSDVANISIPGYPSDFVTAASAEGTEIVTQMNSLAGPAITTLTTTSQSVTSSLLSVKPVLVGLSTMAATTANSTKQLIKNSVSKNIDMLGESLFPFKGYVADGGIGVFALTLTAIPLTLLGLIMMKFGQYTQCTGTFIDYTDEYLGVWIISLAWLLTFFGSIFMFLFAGLFIPFSSIFYETCFLLEEIPKDWTGYTAALMPASSSTSAPSPSPASSRRALAAPSSFLKSLGLTGDITENYFSIDASVLAQDEPILARRLSGMPKINPIAIVDGCWNNQSIMKSLNLTAAFNLDAMVAQLGSGGSVDLGSALNFEKFDTFDAKVQALNKTSFGWDEGTMTTNYNNLKVLCDGGHADSCTGATQIKNTNATIDSTLVWMKKNMTAVGASINNFKGLMNSFKDAMGKISNDTAPLVDAVKKVGDAGDCGFIKKHYEGFVGILCLEMLDSLLFASLSMWVVGFLGIPLIILNVYHETRIGGVGTGEYQSSTTAEVTPDF